MAVAALLTIAGSGPVPHGLTVEERMARAAAAHEATREGYRGRFEDRWLAFSTDTEGRVTTRFSTIGAGWGDAWSEFDHHLPAESVTLFVAPRGWSPRWPTQSTCSQ